MNAVHVIRTLILLLFFEQTQPLFELVSFLESQTSLGVLTLNVRINHHVEQCPQ